MATHIKPGKKRISERIQTNGNSVTNSHELSNAFNNHFSTTGTNLLMKYPLLLMVQIMPITLLAATSSFSVQLVVAMFFLS